MIARLLRIFVAWRTHFASTAADWEKHTTPDLDLETQARR
jgi:hypothetical protein